MSAPSSTPSIAELRAATQPASIFARNSGEHWAGRLYVRRLSPYVTRALLPDAREPERGHVGDDRRRRARGRGAHAARPARRARRGAADPGADPARLQRRRARALAQAVLARRHLPRPLRPLLHRDAAADRARHPRRRRLGRARHVHDARAASPRCSRCWCGRRARSCTSRARRPASRSCRTPSRSPRRARRACGGCAARSASSRSSARSSPSRRRCSRSPRRCSTSRSATSRRRAILVVALVPVAAITAAGHLFAILASERLR